MANRTYKQLTDELAETIPASADWLANIERNRIANRTRYIAAEIADIQSYMAVATGEKAAQYRQDILQLEIERDNLTAGSGLIEDWATATEKMVEAEVDSWIAEAEALAADARDEQRTMEDARQVGLQ